MIFEKMDAPLSKNFKNGIRKIGHKGGSHIVGKLFLNFKRGVSKNEHKSRTKKNC